MSPDYFCEECGAKLTGEEDMTLCEYCQDDEQENGSSLLGDCPLKEMFDFFKSRQ
jgi:hypothetical protein